MKKLLLSAMLLFSLGVMAQNVQLHYDFGKANDKRAADRDYLTATVEFFKPDKMGSTFFFVDFDFNSTQGGINLSYMEFARNIKVFKKLPVQAHLEYNGGHLGGDAFGLAFRNMYLAGASYDIKVCEGFSLGTTLSYKYIQHVEQGPDFQLTLTWFKPFAKHFLFTGFVDVWTEDNTGISFMDKPDGKKVVLLTEPQLWYNFYDNFKIGTEIEISSGFIQNSNKLEVMPTIGFRWDIQ